MCSVFLYCVAKLICSQRALHMYKPYLKFSTSYRSLCCCAEAVLQTHSQGRAPYRFAAAHFGNMHWKIGDRQLLQKGFTNTASQLSWS